MTNVRPRIVRRHRLFHQLQTLTILYGTQYNYKIPICNYSDSGNT